jgi:hypothetical protein
MIKKTLNKLGIEGNFLKGIHEPIVDIFNGEKMNPHPQDQGKGVYSSYRDTKLY